MLQQKQKGQNKLKTNEQSHNGIGNQNSNRQQNSHSPFRLLNTNSNRNEFIIRDSSSGNSNGGERRLVGNENSPKIQQSAFSTQKTSPRILGKGNKNYQTRLQDIFHLYNISLQNQQNQTQNLIQLNKYHNNRHNLYSQIGVNNYTAQSSINQNPVNISQDSYNPQIQQNSNRQEIQQYKQSLEQIIESGVETTNPTQANMPLINPDFERLEQRERFPPSIQQVMQKQQNKTRSTSRKKRNTSSLGKQSQLVYQPYTQKVPTTQPSSKRYSQPLQINNLNGKSSKNQRVIRYQTEINYTENGLDKSISNISCVNTRNKTPDNGQQRRDSLGSSLCLNQDQGINNSQVIQTNNSILNSNQNLNTIKSFNIPQTISNIVTAQTINPISSQSFNTLQINQMPNSINGTPQRIRGTSKYQNPSIITMNNNGSQLYPTDYSHVQNYNENVQNSQINTFLPSHRSDRNDSSPLSSNICGGMSYSNVSCRTPLSQIPALASLNSNKNKNFSQPHSNNNDKPKSALNFYKVKTLNQSESVKRNQISLDCFQLLETLGKGSYAVVKLAIDKRNNEKLAIKIYEKFKLSDPNKFKNVRREINILSKMTHENIIRLYHVIDTVSSLNLVMEYIGNNSLYNFLRAKRKTQLQMNQIRKIFVQIISGIQYLHNKNVCHRDIKLENILIDDDLNLKIIDFGFAVVSPIERKIDSFCGTPSYMAPEIVMKKEYSGQYVDIWTCGVVLFILVCGKFPFKGGDEKELYRKIQKHQYEIPSFVEKGAKQLLQKLLAYNPEDRPSCSEILKDKWLTSFDDTLPTQQQESLTLCKQEEEELVAGQKQVTGNSDDQKKQE